MIVRAFGMAILSLLGVVSSGFGQQAPSVSVAQAAPFIGTWAPTMTPSRVMRM